MMIENLDKEVVQKIWTAHRLGKVKSFTYLPDVSSTYSYVVNEEIIIKFNVWDEDSSLFLRQKLACDYLFSSQLVVPKVLALDESKELCEYDYIVHTKLPGKTLSSIWLSLIHISEPTRPY